MTDTITTLAGVRDADERRVRRDDRAHVFHSWSAQRLLDPVVIAGAEGASFWDDQGNRYLDFASQLGNMNIGHQHPKVVAAIKEQADKLCTVAPIFAGLEANFSAYQLADWILGWFYVDIAKDDLRNYKPLGPTEN